MIIAFSSMIGPVPLQVLLSEKHNSEVEVTSNPIETGAEVNDHAYVKPKKVELEIADGNAAATFNALVTFQEARQPFTLVTGFKVYENMVITEIDATRDKTHSKVLKATVRCKEVIIVETGTAEEDDSKDGKDKNKSDKTTKGKANNEKTADKTNNGTNAGDKSGSTVSAPKSQSLLKSTFGSASPTPTRASTSPGGIGGV